MSGRSCVPAHMETGCMCVWVGGDLLYSQCSFQHFFPHVLDSVGATLCSEVQVRNMTVLKTAYHQDLWRKIKSEISVRRKEWDELTLWISTLSPHVTRSSVCFHDAKGHYLDHQHEAIRVTFIDETFSSQLAALSVRHAAVSRAGAPQP